MKKIVCFIVLILALTTLCEADKLTCKQQWQLFSMGKMQFTTAQNPISNLWLESSILPGYVVPGKNMAYNMYKSFLVFDRFFSKSFYNEYCTSMQKAYCTDMEVVEKLGQDWERAFSNANYRTTNRIFGWGAAYPWSIVEGSFGPSTRSPLNMAKCYLGTSTLLLKSPTTFVIDPTLILASRLTFKSVLFPACAITWNTALAPFIPLYNALSAQHYDTTNNCFITEGELILNQKIAQDVTTKEVEALIKWGDYIIEKTQKFETKHNSNSEQYKNTSALLKADYTDATNDIYILEKAAVLELATQIDNQKSLQELQRKGYDTKKVSQAKQSVDDYISLSDIFSQNITKLVNKYSEFVALRIAETQDPNELLKTYPPTSFNFGSTNSIIYPNDLGFFLTWKQKAQLIGSGRTIDSEGNMFNIKLVPGYKDPAHRQLNSLENDMFGLYELINYKAYHKIGLKSWAAVTDSPLSFFSKMVKYGYNSWQINLSGADWKSIPGGVTKSIASSLISMPIGLVGATSVGSLSLVFNLEEHISDSIILEAYNCSVNSISKPALAYTWNTIVAPPLTLSGPKPAIERCDRGWVEPITQTEIDINQNVNQHISKPDIEKLSNWLKTLKDNCKSFAIGRSLLAKDYHDNLAIEGSHFRNLSESNRIECAEYVKSLELPSEIEKTLEFLKSRGYNQEKVYKASNKINYYLRYNGDFNLIDLSVSYKNNIKNFKTLSKSRYRKLIRAISNHPPLTFENFEVNQVEVVCE